jgi:8-oxo-dGTP pyrophosphatase MutT (NUDIX family)
MNEEESKNAPSPPSSPIGLKSQPKYKKNVFRKVPITSYGIILYTMRDNEPLFLIAQRRDTIAYIDFLRGNYSPRTPLNDFFRAMTYDERHRLLTYDFDRLWQDLVVNHDSHLYRQEYPKAKRAFQIISSQLCTLITNTASQVFEPQWGFPKGKRKFKETSLECALREFAEETKLDPLDVVIKQTAPIIEFYQGSNCKLYKTVYYIGEAHHILPYQLTEYPNTIREHSISEEVSNLHWCRLLEAKEKLTEGRQSLLNNVYIQILRNRWAPPIRPVDDDETEADEDYNEEEIMAHNALVSS